MYTKEDVLRKYILEKINPRVQGDGGNVSLLSFKEQKAILKVQGECTRCPLTCNCFKEWFVQQVSKDLGFDLIVDIKIEKPYFWNK